MFKVVMLIKKRPDLTREQFIDYYDNTHVPFMHRVLSKGAAVHRRNFIIKSDAQQQVNHRNLAEPAEDDYDVISEVMYEDRETAESVIRDFEDEAVRLECEADEANFIMPGSIRRYIVEVHETVFRPLDAVAVG
jgi:hypothetical protein